MTDTNLLSGAPSSDAPINDEAVSDSVCEQSASWRQPAFNFSTEARSQLAEQSTLDWAKDTRRKEGKFSQCCKPWSLGQGCCQRW